MEKIPIRNISPKNSLCSNSGDSIVEMILSDIQGMHPIDRIENQYAQKKNDNNKAFFITEQLFEMREYSHLCLAKETLRSMD